MGLVRWLRRDRAWIGRLASRLRTVRIEGRVFRIDSPLISDRLKSRLLYRRYERTERALLRLHLPTSLPVIELGGGIGVVACIVNARLRDPTRHVVVEPNIRVLPLLATNRGANDARFTIVHGAIAYGSPRVGVTHGEDLLGTTTGGTASETAPALTVEALADAHRFATFTLICDIEGAEIDLVQHELVTLQRRAAVIVVEEHPEIHPPPSRKAMIERLLAAGFTEVQRIRKVCVYRNDALAAGVADLS